MRRWLELVAPLSVGALMFLPDERAHWLAIGLVTSIAFFLAVGTGFSLSVVIAVALVRWIPIHDVVVWREVLIAIGLLLVYVTTDTLKAVAAVAVAIVTPHIAFPYVVAGCNLLPLPLRTFLGLVFVAAIPVARYSFAPMLVVAAITCFLPLIRFVPVIPHAAAIGLFALWPWSGLLARSFPAFLRATHSDAERMDRTIVAPQSVSVDVPPGSSRVTVTMSAGRAQHLWPGSVLGHVAFGQATHDFAIGDLADFGFMRREHFLSSHNRPSRVPVDDIHDFGASAWLNGAGRVTFAVPRGVRTMFVTAVRPGISLRVESVEFE